MIRNASAAHPEKKPDEENPASRLIVRFIGIALLFFGLLILRWL